MAVRNIKTIRPSFWVPPLYSALWKITVEDADGTEHDITSSCVTFNITDGVTDSIGTFEVMIPNTGDYDNVFAHMDKFRYYCDYDTSATTIRFLGRVEKYNTKDAMLTLSGRSEALFLAGKNVTKQYADTDCSDIILDLISSYGESRFTTTNVSASTGTTLTVNWYNKPFMECIKEICDACGYDFYIDATSDAHFFEQGSVENTTDAIVHNNNLIEVNDNSTTIEDMKNKVVVYGAETDGTQVIYTSSDSASNLSTYGTREDVVTDSNITDEVQAQQYADYLRSTSGSTNPIEVKSFLLAALQPGENIQVSSPIDGIAPNTYRCVTYTHELSSDGLSTTVSINKETRRVSHVIADRITVESQRQQTQFNAYGLSFSKNYLYDNDVGSHISTKIENGALKLSTGSSGSWTSDITASPDGNNIYVVYLVAQGTALDGASFEVSGNSGVSYDSVSLKSLTVLGTSIGTNLRVKVTFSSASTEIDSLAIMYSTQ